MSPSLLSLNAIRALDVFGTALALLLYFQLIQTPGSLGTASHAYLRMGVSVLLGIVFLGKEFSLVVGVGLLTAFLDVALINMPGKTK